MHFCLTTPCAVFCSDAQFCPTLHEPTSFLCSWDFLDKNTGVSCHCLLYDYPWNTSISLPSLTIYILIEKSLTPFNFPLESSYGSKSVIPFSKEIHLRNSFKTYKKVTKELFHQKQMDHWPTHSMGTTILVKILKHYLFS